MSPQEMAREIARLRIRCEINEALLAKTSLALWLKVPGTSLDEARASLLAEYEEIAAGVLRNADLPKGVDPPISEDARRDQVREILNHMKTFIEPRVGGLSDG